MGLATSRLRRLKHTHILKGCSFDNRDQETYSIVVGSIPEIQSNAEAASLSLLEAFHILLVCLQRFLLRALCW